MQGSKAIRCLKHQSEWSKNNKLQQVEAIEPPKVYKVYVSVHRVPERTKGLYRTYIRHKVIYTMHSGQKSEAHTRHIHIDKAYKAYIIGIYTYTRHKVPERIKPMQGIYAYTRHISEVYI